MLTPKLKNFIVFILLFHILSLAFFLTADLPKDSIFQEPIRYAADDGVYHMRLVENMLLGGHFPKRIYFDPFTYFPYGTYIHFPPLYDLTVAGTVWLFSLGKPTLESINLSAPYVPPIICLLTIVVIFFIGKVLWGKWAGLFSALLMATSSPFIFRSLLGATDHHQAEVLLSSLALLFLILTFKNKATTKFWLYTILTGISLGLYFLVWNGALLFLFIIFITIATYYLIRFLQGKNEDGLLLAGAIILFITLSMILPLLGHPDLYYAKMYNLQHYSALLLGLVSFLLIGLFGKLVRTKQLKSWLLPVFLLATLVLSLPLLYFIAPSTFAALTQSFKAVKIGMVDHASARNFVGEMHPLNLKTLLQKVSYLFYFSLLAWLLTIYNFFKKTKAEDYLLIVWYLVIMLMTGLVIPAIGQNRFIYYFAANIAILSGYLAVRIINYAITYLRKSKHSPDKIFLRIGVGVLLFNVFFFTFYPFPLNLVLNFPENLPEAVNNALQISIYGSIQRTEDWYAALAWIKENTPETGLDYYAYYQEPVVDPITNKINPYPYPESAYGILARWDIGHAITYYAHRIPISNPFQEGLGKNIDGNIQAGETTFFIETAEAKAQELLDTLRARYIITDGDSANAKGGFSQAASWALSTTEDYYYQTGENQGEPNENYYQSMLIRLHYFDATNLEHFRLVYESETKTNTLVLEEEKEINNIKMFEYVKGAKIVGQTLFQTNLEVSTTIKTNQDREIIYQRNIEIKDGTFELTVPYAGTYTIKNPYREKTINLTEADILEGKEIRVNLW